MGPRIQAWLRMVYAWMTRRRAIGIVLLITTLGCLLYLASCSKKSDDEPAPAELAKAAEEPSVSSTPVVVPVLDRLLRGNAMLKTCGYGKIFKDCSSIPADGVSVVLASDNTEKAGLILCYGKRVLDKADGSSDVCDCACSK